MDDLKDEKFEEIFAAVRPYISSPDRMKNELRNLLRSSSNTQEFEKKIEDKISSLNDPTQTADYRIFLNKMRSEE